MGPSVSGEISVAGEIRIFTEQTGMTKWKDGVVEVVEKDTKSTLVVRFKAGGPTKTFTLTENVKSVRVSDHKEHSRIMITLLDSSNITVQYAMLGQVQWLSQYLKDVEKNPNRDGKSISGSSPLSGVLGKRTSQRDAKRHYDTENRTPNKRPTAEGSAETPVKRTQGPPGRTPRVQHLSGSQGNVQGSKGLPSLSPNNTATSSTARASLSEPRNDKRKRTLTPEEEITNDYPKENDSSRCPNLMPSNSRPCGEQQAKRLFPSHAKQEDVKSKGVMPLQTTTSFYGQTGTREFSSPSPFSERSCLGSQFPAAKRSLGLVTPHTATACKKIKSTSDFVGWNKSKPFLSTQQPQLQGFSNLGNTCYMNAILQSLFALHSFTSDMLRQGIPWNRVPPNSLLRRLAHLLSKKDVCTMDYKKELLKRVKTAISASAERFSGYAQNDAHEFLSQCLDQLKEDVERLNKKWRLEPAQGESPKPSQTDSASDMPYTCPVAANMEFEVLHTITCRVCGEVVKKKEQFNDLSIDLPRKKSDTAWSIQDSLDLFLRAEEVEYACEKCESRNATVTHKFIKLPRVLILHLKRYSFDVQLAVNNKVGQQVIIPLYLTLQAHCVEGTRSALSLRSSKHTHGNMQPLRSSQSMNAPSTSSNRKRYTFKPRVLSISESDTDEDQLKRALNLSKQVVETNRFTGCDGTCEDEMLATVMAISQDESGQQAISMLKDSEVDHLGLHASNKHDNEDEQMHSDLEARDNTQVNEDLLMQMCDQEPSNSSPDTGFCDEVDFPDVAEVQEVESEPCSEVAGHVEEPVYSSIIVPTENWEEDDIPVWSKMDIVPKKEDDYAGKKEEGAEKNEQKASGDEDKENRTPVKEAAVMVTSPLAGPLTEGDLQAEPEPDWMDQYSLDREREERELQEALAQSLRDQEAREQREEDELKRATELSLQEFQHSLAEVMGSDDDSGNEGSVELERSDAEALELKCNAETGDLPHSFQLLSVVSHIGSDSSAGHYISDTFDVKKQSWFTYDDTDVTRTSEATVRDTRERSGYIFFYIHKEILEQLLESDGMV
ncbi:ubiquitin carboxyl-terminal hydrolase 37 isoform X1 [Lampetra fluviatilis]